MPSTRPQKPTATLLLLCSALASFGFSDTANGASEPQRPNFEIVTANSDGHGAKPALPNRCFQRFSAALNKARKSGKAMPPAESSRFRSCSETDIREEAEEKAEQQRLASVAARTKLPGNPSDHDPCFKRLSDALDDARESGAALNPEEPARFLECKAAEEAAESHGTDSATSDQPIRTSASQDRCFARLSEAMDEARKCGADLAVEDAARFLACKETEFRENAEESSERQRLDSLAASK